MASVEYLDKGNDDGTNFGQSTTSKIGFYGLTTPIVQPTVVFAATSSTTVAASVAADLYALCAALDNLGLIAKTTVT
jgi:hypothetical protein